MVEVIVTRGCQITLTKDIRRKLSIKEGDIVIMNTVGNTVFISKKNPETFEKHGFLPENFSKTLENFRKLSYTDRLKKLRIIQ